MLYWKEIILLHFHLAISYKRTASVTRMEDEFTYSIVAKSGSIAPVVKLQPWHVACCLLSGSALAMWQWLHDTQVRITVQP
jgi:hypothetical protein